MPTIFDNISTPLLPTLRQTLAGAYRADICVGYFNLRGWASIHDLIENFDGSDNGRARVLIGMYQAPDDEMRRSLRMARKPDILDGPARARLHRDVAESFREQLELGAPTDQDEATLRRIAKQIRAGKLQVKLFLRHTLHAKLYLGFRHDHAAPILSYLGSSNLTASGLSHGGELNVDVLEQDACTKLKDWFQDRWDDTACMDISDELATLIENSWAREDIVPPYFVYLKMAYHLAQEAREGEREFKLPKVFRGQLLDFQAAAVSLAAKHLNTRGGVLVGDVVGLGKTRVAAAIAKIYEEDHDGARTLILCPKNLVSMWQQQIDLYDLKAEVIPLSKVLTQLPKTTRRKLVLIDESHNLRNRDGKRYQMIREYVEGFDCHCILLTATPYNKMYLDLGNQLRLFVDEKRDLGIRPERYFQTMNELDFMARFQAPARSLTAFEKSEFPDDWRDLMRLYMVRRTRQFIIQNYAIYDEDKDRYYVTIEGGRSYFPKRLPKNLTFALDDNDPSDQYARLYQDSVVDVINALCLPRYGLGNYVDEKKAKAGKPEEKRLLDDLGRAGPRLMGFCRTNLFKRLESSGYSFLLSLERHVLRNLITLHAIQTGQMLPIGTQESELLDSSRTDTDADDPEASTNYEEYTEDNDDYTPSEVETTSTVASAQTWEAYQARAAQVYDLYQTQFKKRFKWVAPTYFSAALARDLKRDAESLLALLREAGAWNPARDSKLDALTELVCNTHADDKVLIFTQFADTALYLKKHLAERGVKNLEAATGQTTEPTLLARRFSPLSNSHKFGVGETELRVLVATDTLSEGQNLQDSAIVVQYDLPWAIIRMIQRAGRVDRIGQKSDTIIVYSYLPAEGVERVIRLQRRLQERLQTNSEVVGSDESFFGEMAESKIRDLYTENSSALEDEQDTDVDLSSAALQIWNNAIKADPSIKNKVERLPNVIYASKPHGAARAEGPPGVMVYLKTDDGTDALVRMSEDGQVVSQLLSAILQAAQCTPDTPGLPRNPKHHPLVQEAVRHALEETAVGTGTLGQPRSARRRAWERLTAYREQWKKKPNLFVDMAELDACIQALHLYRLTARATEQINRMIRTGAHDADLIQLIINLREEGRLSVIEEEPDPQEPRILCSLGFFPAAESGGGSA